MRRPCDLGDEDEERDATREAEEPCATREAEVRHAAAVHKNKDERKDERSPAEAKG